MMPKPPIQFLVDSFTYEEYTGINKWSEAQFADPVIINKARIDRGTHYTSNQSGKQLLYSGLIFCYPGLTDPVPMFKEQSRVTYDGVSKIITKVVPVYEAYEPTLYAYELEVI